MIASPTANELTIDTLWAIAAATKNVAALAHLRGASELDAAGFGAEYRAALKDAKKALGIVRVSMTAMQVELADCADFEQLAITDQGKTWIEATKEDMGDVLDRACDQAEMNVESAGDRMDATNWSEAKEAFAIKQAERSEIAMKKVLEKYDS